MRRLPQVSVIVPAFNPGVLLHATLASVIRQTFTDWDLVVVDDGSTEDLTWIAGIDPRIRLVRQDNGGVSRARNTGIECTHGSLVAFCDADDVWHPDKLARQLDRFGSSDDLLLSHTAFHVVNRVDEWISTGFHRDGLTYETLRRHCGICTSTVVVRRSALDVVGGFDPSLLIVQDWDLWLRLAMIGRLDCEPTDLVAYRNHPGTLSSNFRRLEREWSAVATRHAAPTLRTDIAAMRRIIGAQAFDQARQAWRSGNARQVSTAATYALSRSPRYVLGEALRLPGRRLGRRREPPPQVGDWRSEHRSTDVA
jgi:glycosyltransferase involved in cell wall biosynthesis